MDIWDVFAKAFIGASAKKAFDKVASLLSRLKTRTKSATTAEDIQGLKEEIGNLEAELDQTREELDKKIRIVFSPSLEKILALGVVKAFLEGVYAISQKDLNEKDLQNIRVELHRPHVTAAFKALFKPLAFSGLKKAARDLGKEINSLAQELSNNYKVVTRNCGSEILNDCLCVCNELEAKLSEFVKLGS